MSHAGIEKTYRDTIVGHGLKGMDVHYIVITDEALKGDGSVYGVVGWQINSNIHQVSFHNSVLGILNTRIMNIESRYPISAPPSAKRPYHGQFGIGL